KSVSIDHVMELCYEIAADEEEIKVAVEKSRTGAILAGGGAFAGGLLGGPVGIAVGGTLGSLCGYLLSRGTFRPLPEILKNMSATQKKKLNEKINKVLIREMSTMPYYVAGAMMGNNPLISLVKNNKYLQQLLKQVVHTFVKDDLGGVFQK
uniref:Uncharacterized protein n=1 Tax=Periophthalmus magnuspinnatus TaxID=409849 RepID=A0A3B4B3L3_9GOBI